MEVWAYLTKMQEACLQDQWGDKFGRESVDKIALTVIEIQGFVAALKEVQDITFEDIQEEDDGKTDNPEDLP